MIKVEEHKLPQHDLASQKYLKPKKLYLPLSQHTGAPSKPLVDKGDSIEEASLIAQSDGFISANLHAPVSGKVIGIDPWCHPILKKAPALAIQPEGRPKDYSLRPNVDSLSKEDLLSVIASSGIVGMGGAAFPTQVKLKPPKPIDTLIINGCECEPYLAADYRLMIENFQEIFKGIEIVCRLIEPKEVIFAIEENKPQAIKNINLAINSKKFKIPQASCLVLKSVYPQGGEKQLIQAATKRKVPGGKLPLDVGCLVHNVATLFAIYQAVYLNKPLIERMVSFCGDALVTPKNLWVKIGTTLNELFQEKVLEFKTEPKKIISGGPMMGISLASLDYPVLKASGGFLFLTEAAADSTESPCIRCARCVDTCPMNLLPLEYPKRAKKEDYKALENLNISDCMECGCCAYECPAKIPIVHYIKVAKEGLLKTK